MTRVVGLTGGIGSGKTTVSRLLRELGATVVDADAVVHELQAAGSPLLGRIVEAFGEDVLLASGELDREGLGARVFGDEDARRRLNAIVHPAVGIEMARRVDEARRAGAPLVVVDVPLLLETGRGGFDAVVVVYCTEAQQIERQRARDGASLEEARQRVAAQLSIEEKRRRADHVIDNSGSPEETERQVRALYAALTA